MVNRQLVGDVYFLGMGIVVCSSNGLGMGNGYSICLSKERHSWNTYLSKCRILI